MCLLILYKMTGYRKKLEICSYYWYMFINGNSHMTTWSSPFIWHITRSSILYTAVNIYKNTIMRKKIFWIITVAPISLQGNKFEWCSYGPTRTIGLISSEAKSIACINLCTAPVHPLPTNMTASSSEAWTALRTISRASCL